jgi:Immunity protein 53
MGDTVMNGQLEWLQEWYSSQCDGDWEHEYRVRISTLDNPGWSVRINLAETELSGVLVSREEVNRSDLDWFTFVVEADVFDGACGSRNLSELLAAFRDIAERASTRS